MSGEIADILDKAADLVEPEGAWTTEVDARDRFGDEVGIADADAVCFCAAGAVYRVAPYPERMAALRFLERFLGVDGIPLWNDTRTQAEVVAKLREAAAKARSHQEQV